MSSYDYFGNSYAANIFMVGINTPGACLNSNSPYLRPTTRVPTPSRTLYYEENIGRWAWTAKRKGDICDIPGADGIDPGPTKAIRGWHGKDWTYNRAFVDAHAATQKVYIEGTEDEEGYANHYRVEHLSHYPAYSVDCENYISVDDYEEMHRIYHCVIIRGQGWQKDTLPAPLIATPLIRQQTGASLEGCFEGD